MTLIANRADILRQPTVDQARAVIDQWAKSLVAYEEVYTDGIATRVWVGEMIPDGKTLTDPIGRDIFALAFRKRCAEKAFALWHDAHTRSTLRQTFETARLAYIKNCKEKGIAVQFDDFASQLRVFLGDTHAE